MTKIKIVSDSSSDILALDNMDFAYAPMKVITKDREFVDDSKLDVEEMVHFLDKYNGKSQTSCPNIADWIEAFDGASDIICITITSALSGSYNSACNAKRIYETENPGKRVFVLDSLSAGPELALAIEKIQEFAIDDMPYEDICENIKKYIESTSLVFMLRSLHNFAANGRVSPIVAGLVGIAGICIVGKASDKGTLEPLHKCRGESRSLEKLVAEMRKMGYRNGKVRIAHCENSLAAEKLKELLVKNFECDTIKIHKLRGLCSFYAEKGGMLVAFER